MDRILLAYERKGHTFDGYFDFTVDDEARESENCRDTFQDVPFRLIMNTLIKEVRDDPDAKVLFMRLEQQPIPIAVELDPHLVDLIHKDPVMFLRHMDPFEGGSQRVQIGRMNLRKDSVKNVAPQPIPAGYDTLADAFGDFVYVRLKGSKTESVWDGRWYEWHHLPSYPDIPDGFISIPDDLYKAPGCCKLTQDPFFVNEMWAKYSTKELLMVAERRKQDRLFLPRAWNKPGPWVRTEDLRKKYETFLKEKEQWKPTRTPTDDTSE